MHEPSTSSQTECFVRVTNVHNGLLHGRFQIRQRSHEKCSRAQLGRSSSLWVGYNTSVHFGRTRQIWLECNHNGDEFHTSYKILNYLLTFWWFDFSLVSSTIFFYSLISISCSVNILPSSESRLILHNNAPQLIRKQNYAILPLEMRAKLSDGFLFFFVLIYYIVK